MQVELDHIGSAEAEGGQGREKQLVDALIAGHPNRAGSRPGRMRGDDHARAMSFGGHGQVSTLKQVPADPTFRMHELLIGGQGEALFDRCQIKQPVIFATHQPGDPCRQQIRDDGSVAVLAIEADKGLIARQAQLGLIGHDHLQSSEQLPAVVGIARIAKRSQPLMGMGLQERGPRANHFPTLAPRVARRTRPLATAAVARANPDPEAAHAVVRPVGCRPDRRPPIVALADPTDLPRPAAGPGRASASCKNTPRSASTLAWSRAARKRLSVERAGNWLRPNKAMNGVANGCRRS